MSSSCMFVLRNAKEQDYLRRKLIHLATLNKCGICCEPTNDLLSMRSVKMYPYDFAFEVCDSFDNHVAELLLSYEGTIINGEQASLPLFQRLQILEAFALICIPYTEELEIYLGDNNPYLPDYSTYKLMCTEIAKVLYKEYQKDSTTPFIPCVHLVVEKQEKTD